MNIYEELFVTILALITTQITKKNLIVSLFLNITIYIYGVYYYIYIHTNLRFILLAIFISIVIYQEDSSKKRR